MTEKISFYDMFPVCRNAGELTDILKDSFVVSAAANKETRHMKITVLFPKPVSPVYIGRIESAIAEEFGLESVEINSVYLKETVSDSAKQAAEKPESNASDKIIMGHKIKGQPVKMADVKLDSGRVIIEGDVFSVESREIQERKAWVLSFDMTDNTSSLKISKFMQDPNAKDIVDKIKSGMHLMVQGSVSYNRYDGDITVEPTNIVVTAKQGRVDMAKEKRVELHLHTSYSTLDALTNAKAAVKLAAKWGHPAVAITDHGVVQAFPEAWHAGQDCGIKVIYGVEGYFINDVDDRIVVHGSSNISLDDEFVAFDIETTGLDQRKNEITEIGAVIYKNGKMGEVFQTFVNPQMHIPREITQLTGITDADVKDAPNLKEALKSFLNFIGDRPLVAHNADFDMGFISSGCERCGLEFNNTSLDTLIMAQNLLPELKKFKLDIVADHLGLPEFNHHRASDDAKTVGYMLEKFFAMLKNAGVDTVQKINPYMQELRGKNQVKRHPKHIIILVKNKAGLKNLYKLVTLGHLKYFKKNPIIPKSELIRYREGLIVGSACEAGELFSAVVARKSYSELKRIASFYDFLEIQPLCNNNFMLYNGQASTVEDLRDFNRTIVRLGEDLNKPVVATGDVHFLNPEDEIYRHILLAAKKFADADKSLPLYFKTTDEMLEEFSYLGEEKAKEIVVTNTNAIADLCEEIELLPKDLFAPKVENSAEDLKSLVYGRMHELYGDNPPELVTKRVETELGDILNRHYDVIYMSAQKLVADSLAHGYLVGSRGSVGSSIVAFMSGITEVNSLPAHYRCPKCKHTNFEAGKGYGCGADMPDAVCPVCGAKYAKDGFDIPFETFLGFGGDKVPDIDLNFSGEYQANAHKYTEELFGRDHVFRAGTIGTLADKTAYGYVKNYLAERGITVTKAEENRLTAGCVGVKRTTGQHPGGLVIIPQDMDITDFCPAQHPADDPNTDIITTHFEYHSMEANLLKLDMLGHDDPTMIRMLEDMTGVDAKNIPLDDKDTMSIFKSPKVLGLPDDDPIIGKTGSIGIPEFGTGFTRQMLVDTQPTQFDTLVRLSGFSHGTDVWLGNAKELITSGTATVSQAIGCRDDIMLYLISMGMDEKMAFKIMEAVRKGKVKKGGFQPGWEEKMVELGVPDWYIESCRKIAYLFPKAHAVAYVMMAFRIAWFKVHKPLAFYSAYFYRRSQKDSFDANMMTNGLDNVRNAIRNIKANPDATAKELDLLTTLEACYEFYMRGFSFETMDLYRSDATKFIVTENGLIPPFVSIAGLGETAARDIVAHRNDKVFVSVEEFSAACPKVSNSHIEQLKNAGALGNLPDTSQISLF